MADWTLIVTTIGTAGVTGGLGYLASKRASDATITSIQAESDRVQEQIEAENRRLREQDREDHLRNRQGTYHQLLSAERRLAGQLGIQIGEAAYETYLDFLHLANGAILFGTDDVGRAVQALIDKYGEIAREVGTDKSGDPKAWFAVLARHVDELNRLRGTMMHAMRTDVGPA